MPELRKDPIVERWVVISPERGRRPIELQNEVHPIETGFDPFAEGNEFATPHETLACRDVGSEPDGPGWRVRVVPNKFPALKIDELFDERIDGLCASMNGFGVHEVIIECPHGEAHISRLTVENFREILGIYRERLIELKKDPRIVHVSIFKNQGLLAGASVAHSHSQLIATPIVPTTMTEEISGAELFFNEQRRSIFDAIIEQELATGSRLVLETTNFLAFCPYASRFSYEIWILPKPSGSHFENIQPAILDELGSALKTILVKLEQVLGDPAYNYVIHTAPFIQPELPHFRWHIEIYPRTTGIAGFELGSGFYINSVFPEDAAEQLRGA